MHTGRTVMPGKTRYPAKMLAHWQFYAMMLLPLAYIIIFAYIPMPGILMAFQQYSPSKGIWGSEWVGLFYFKQFFLSPSSVRIILNTLKIGIYALVAGIPTPIILAIALYEIGNRRFRKTVQLVTYAPYFISTVVIVGMIFQLTDLRLGMINRIITALGGQAVNFMAKPELFSSIYVWSGIWQGTGYYSIIYMAALSNISREMQEAAIVDGVSRLQRIWHIDLPVISPQILIILIFNISGILGVGFEKIYLMQNTLNITASEVIPTFVYKVGLINGDYGFSTAVGLFNSVVAVVLLVLANRLVRLFSETSLW